MSSALRRTPEVIDDAVAVGEIEQASRSVLDIMSSRSPRQALVPTVAAGHGVTPSVQAGELAQRLEVIREAMNTAMRVGVDYGVVPGTDKPTLFKPGAEKLGVLFQLDIQIVNDKAWGPGEHLTVESHATVFHAPSGARLGYGEGMATSREKKYAKRYAERACPQCRSNAVIKGKREYGGGWICFRKKGGCGANFGDEDPQITGQKVGEIDNPDLPDTWNTIVKMAAKRARVDAVLAVTGASALFTQDAEDDPVVAERMQSAPAPAQQQRRAPEPMSDAERSGRAEALAVAKAVMEAGLWDERRMKSELVIARATDTSTLEAAIASVPFDQLQTLHHRMLDLLEGATS